MGHRGVRRLHRRARFDPPAAESSRADRILAGPLGRYAADVVVLYEDPARTVDDPAFAGPVQQALAAVPRTGIARLESYWSSRNEAFVSRDRHATYVTVQFSSADDQERVAALKRIQDRFRVSGLTVRFGGTTAMTEQVNARAGTPG